MRTLSTLIVGAALVLGGTALIGCGGGGTSSTGTDSTDKTDGTDSTNGTDATDGTSATDTTNGTDATDNTDGTGGTDSTDNTVGTDCEPYCADGWACGPDGCGGDCGKCAGTTTCNNAKHQCEEPPPPPPPAKEFGEQCGRKGDCQPSILGPDGFESNPQWPACANAQCESGTCLEPTCSKSCTITQDNEDWQGNDSASGGGPDGIDDASAPFDDCDGAIDGPLGQEYQCVQLVDPGQGNPVNLCQAGTTFQPCSTNGDCSNGETCQLQYVNSTYKTLCSGQPKNAAAIGESCNRNPEDGDVKYCNTTLCFGVGCTGFCEANSDCYTFGDGGGCSGGKCGNDSSVSCESDDDCSAWECQKDFEIFGEPEPVFDICMGKDCDSNGGCPGDSFCLATGNGETGLAADWAPICAAATVGNAKLGEECETDEEDNIPLPECNGPCLLSGQCSSICETDAHCTGEGGNSFLCYAIASTIDIDDDGDAEKYAHLGYCIDYPGTQAPCASNADCGDGEACQFHSTKSMVDGKWVMTATGLCSEFKTGEADLGAACGGNTGVNCKSGFCLGSDADTGQPGWCTELCKAGDPVQDDISLGQFTGTYDLKCRALYFSEGGTPDTPADDLWLPVYFPYGGGSTHADCSEDFTCAAGNICSVVPVAFGAGPGTLTYECTEPLAADYFVNKVGEACNLTGSDTSPLLGCDSQFCLADKGVDKGYCGAHCKTNADCAAGGPDMICADYAVIERADAENTASVKLCQKQASCIPCESNSDCAGDYVCVNAGALGLLEKRRCAPPCTGDSDCSGTDGGATCAESINGATGEPEGTNGCIPDTCE